MTRSARLAAAAAALTLGALVLTPGSASAADEINIDYVDSGGDTVSVLLAVDGLPAGTAVDPAAVSVRVNDEPVEASTERVVASSIERTTILALDASRSMAGARFESARIAAKQFIAEAPKELRIGLLTFSGSVSDVVEPTTDHDAVTTAIDGIKLTSGTHVYEAIAQATGLAGSEGARSVLVLSDGQDTGGSTTLDEAVTAATTAEVIVDVVALDQNAANRRLLGEISDASGGKVIKADAGALNEVFSAQADALANQLVIEFPREAVDGNEISLDVALTVAGTSYSDSAFVTLETAGSDGPTVVDMTGSLVGSTGLMVGAAALAMGLAGILGIVMVGARGPSAAQARMDSFLGSGSAGVTAHRSHSDGRSSIKDAAVAATEKVIKGDFETRLVQRLAGAGSSLTAAEWLLMHAGIAVASGLAGLLLKGGALMVVGFLAGIALPWLYLKRKHSKRLAAFNAQLAETLTLVGGGLSAGLSLVQAIDTVVREGHEPMAGELRRALVEQRLGVGIEEALDGVGARMDSKDFGWVVMAIRIQREVGGNLAELLSTVADTLREREYLRRQVRVLSAEGRFSGYVLGALPVGMFVYMLVFKEDLVSVLWTTGTGIMLLAIAVSLLSMGFFIMSRLVKIEV